MLVRATVLFASFLTLMPVIALAQDDTGAAPPAAATDSSQPQASAPDAMAPDGGAAIGKVCQTELSSLCKDAGDKRAAKIRCLNDNKDKLGADCSAAIKAMREKRQAMRAACKDDAAKNCPDAKGRDLMACLRGKLSDLSKSCSDALASMPQPVKQ